MPPPSPLTNAGHPGYPLAVVGRWAWYSLPVATLLAALSLWSASRAPSEESTRLLHEAHLPEWQYIRNITGK